MPKAIVPSYLPIFRRDVQDAVTWSEEQFAAAAADRYSLLIGQALRDLCDDPARPGTKARPDLVPHAYVYHLRFSRDRVAGERVKKPRHFVLYRHIHDKIEFARLLHDSRDFARHLPQDYRYEDE